ncbi:ATP-binding cassette domain-containing protein [Streptomyces sp. NPDC056161]|uniref:ABC transporter ATP-binding protein n=1 Tax=Streptomyces sp. NPDC056161 TaxID=3345732 RepID=UPI0035DCD4F4
MTSGQHMRDHGEHCVSAEDLVVRYRVRTREEVPGRRRPRTTTKDVHAVSGVTFHIAAGEIVGFLGPNGAGKTSVMKCLSGLLRPTAGHVRVLGQTPHKRASGLLKRITMVMGQRNQLLWDLPAMDTFLANKAIYGIPPARFERILGELTDVLRLSDLVGKPVRQLSLGERGRCELAAALLHEPAVLFLDEPTLGLDVEGQQAVRRFLNHYRERHRATVLLTSHDMTDIVEVADRVMLIDGGRVRYQGNLRQLVEELAPEVVIRFRAADEPPASFFQGTPATWRDGDQTCVRVPRPLVTAVVTRLLSEWNIADLVVEPPAVEEVLRKLITEGRAPDGPARGASSGSPRA